VSAFLFDTFFDTHFTISAIKFTKELRWDFLRLELIDYQLGLFVGRRFGRRNIDLYS